MACRPSANGSMMAMAYAPDSGNAGGFTQGSRRIPAGATPRRSRCGPTVLAASAPRTKRRPPCAPPTPPGAARIGIDRKIRPDWLVGAFIGGGSGRLSVDLELAARRYRLPVRRRLQPLRMGRAVLRFHRAGRQLFQQVEPAGAEQRCCGDGECEL